MSSNSEIKFTPINFPQNNKLFKSNHVQKSLNINQKLNINSSNILNRKHQNKYTQSQNFNSIGNLSYFQNNVINDNNINIANPKYNEINNIYVTCYILIMKYDKCAKKLLFNFFEQQKLNSGDIKTVGDDKIIIKFQNQIYRNEFINAYNKVKDNFFGVELKFIDEEERDRIVNNAANRTFHRISYNNNFINNESNLIHLPQEKSWFQKFIDVFLNL